MQDTGQNEWFQVWFNSPYYHILYKDRDENEARRFIDALFDYLRPRPGAPALDLACGKGRYSRYLEEKGCDVTGLDISEESIAYARQFESERLHFFQHDMRAPFRSNYFDYIFNFFTSFGYFENERDHLGAIRHIAQGLKPGGRFVLDFFNAETVVRELKAQETKEIDQYTFTIRKKLDEQGYIVKTIAFEAGGQAMSFTEKVRAFTLADFEGLFQKAGLRTARLFGDYALNDFDPAQSDRLILVAEKI